MDRAWMKERLDTYLELLNRCMRLPSERQEPIQADLRQQEPTVMEILKRLDPELATFDFDDWVGDIRARASVERGLGVLADRDEWAIRLAPDAPSLPADQFHPWVWESAKTLWDTRHFRQAVQTAATAITAYTQSKLGRRDLADSKLMQSAFGGTRPGVARLVVNTDGLGEDTAKGMQTGVLSFAVGCFQAIRNPATHEHDIEWDEQTALEYLAALSVLARWIDAAKVETP